MTISEMYAMATEASKTKPSFAKELRRLRRVYNLTQEKTASILKTTPNVIFYWEKESRAPAEYGRFGVLMKIIARGEGVKDGSESDHVSGAEPASSGRSGDSPVAE